jgi:hypothetical protein
MSDGGADDAHERTMKLWMEGAKSCGQLAMAAMFLPVFWLREVGGIKSDAPLQPGITSAFYGAWIAWIASIALSHTYQLSAIKLIVEKGRATVFPRLQYGLMVAALVVGAVAFAVGARDMLRQRPEPRVAAPVAAAPAASAARTRPD